MLPLRKGPYQIIEKSTDVTYKLIDQNKKNYTTLHLLYH